MVYPPGRNEGQRWAELARGGPVRHMGLGSSTPHQDSTSEVLLFQFCAYLNQFLMVAKQERRELANPCMSPAGAGWHQEIKSTKTLMGLEHCRSSVSDSLAAFFLYSTISFRFSHVYESFRADLFCKVFAAKKSEKATPTRAGFRDLGFRV